jgi:RecA-family ATPase
MKLPSARGKPTGSDWQAAEKAAEEERLAAAAGEPVDVWRERMAAEKAAKAAAEQAEREARLAAEWEAAEEAERRASRVAAGHLSLEEAEEELPDPEMLIGGLLPDQTVTIALGETGAGKTYVALECMAAIALGRSAFGEFPVNRTGHIIYFAGEDPGPLVKSRIKVLQQRYGSLAGKITIITHAIPLDEEQLEADLDYIREVEADRGPIALIINDTYQQSITGRSANDGIAAGEFTKIVKDMRDEFGCAVLSMITRRRTARGRAAARTYSTPHRIPSM